MKNTTHLTLNNAPIALDAIIWLEGDWNYTRIYPQGQPMRMSAYTLKWFEQRLAGFLRIRKDAIINPAHVSALEYISTHPRRIRVVLTNGDQIEVTRRRQAFVCRKLKVEIG